jgi:signal transduction histidine kinase
LAGIKKSKTEARAKLKILSLSQIVIELLMFFVIMELVGDKLIGSTFFFLPIISAAIIFGFKGAMLAALGSAVLVNAAAVWEYFGLAVNYIFNRIIFDQAALGEMRSATLNLIKILVTSNFYLVIAVVSSYSFKMVFRREKKLMEHAEKLLKEKQIDKKERERLDKYARRLSHQDRELKKMNIELSKKVNQLRKSERSIIRAFRDLQAARKRTEAERKKTAAIISNFIDPIILIDKDNKINLINPAAKEIFGFLDSDLGKEVGSKDNYSMDNFRDIIKREFKVKTARDLKSADSNIEEVTIDYGDQELTYKVITAKVVDDDNNYLGRMKIFYNLTREKMIDKLKSEFISIAAHQLRTPLSAIKWVIKMVLDGDAGKLNKEQKKLLFKGYQSNERIIGLVNDMLNVSRIEEGRFGYNFKKEDFVTLVKTALSNLESKIKTRNIKIVFNKPKEVPQVYMDRKKMDLVLQNLLENAVKYTPEYGTITITLEPGKNFLKVRVKDNGVGIPAQDQTKIFSKFFRATNVIRMQTEGSGLGLFIVKNIIKAHGGEITFTSEEGKGTEFVFTLPLNKSFLPTSTS